MTTESTRQPVRYLTDDCDVERLELMIRPPDGNGDWYVSILPEGHRFGPAVRITTHVPRPQFEGVPRAVNSLYRAISGNPEPAPPLFERPTHARAALELLEAIQLELGDRLELLALRVRDGRLLVCATYAGRRWELVLPDGEIDRPAEEIAASVRRWVTR